MVPNTSSGETCLEYRKEGKEDKQEAKYFEENGKARAQVEIQEKYEKIRGPFGFKTQLIWSNIFYMVTLHAIYFYCVVTFDYLKDWRTTLWMLTMFSPSGFGVTGGVHRFWSHRSYKAKLPLRIILMLCYHVAGQNTMVDWVRDHRVHHKYSETDADPHNSNRGFFFAHMGWLMMRKHPEVIKKGQGIDMTDVLDDPVVQFAQRHFVKLKLLMCFVLPTLLPVYGWNETWTRAIVSQCVIRYVTTLHCTWSVNSAAHIWGMKPYNRNINPAENWMVAFAAMGEGWHNYHHVFPWDYRAAELGTYALNVTTLAIDTFSKIGWAYDLKYPSDDMILSVASKKGDGTYQRPFPKPTKIQ